MASILPFIRKAQVAFDDRVTQIIGEAFEAACVELHIKGKPSILCETMAKRIIDAAKNGERDMVRLRDAGLAAFGLDSDGQQASQR